MKGNESMKKIGVIFGGMSTEHEVSISSGTSIISNLDKQKYEKFFHPLKYMKSLPTALLVDSQPRRAHYFATQSIVCYTLLNGCLFCFAFASKVFLSVMH